MNIEQQGSVPAEGTNVFPPELNGLPQAGAQRLFDLHQREHGDAMQEEYEAVLSRWNFNSLDYPTWAYRPLDRSCGVE